jgi:glutamate-1-semialdehyde 2,1-aminomutase
MRFVLPAGPVFQAGTLSGNPVSVAAGIATLRELRDRPPYERLEKSGARLEAGLRQAATDVGLPHCVNRVGSMWTLFFNEGPVTDYPSAKRSDTGRFAKFFRAMIDRGVYLPCSQFEAAFLSVAHGEKLIDQTLAAAREALAEAARN